VLERLLLKGHIVVKNLFGFSATQDFKRGLHEAAFELIEIPHVRHSGKNSAYYPSIRYLATPRDMSTRSSS